MEKAVVAALYELAARPDGERLYELLPIDSGCWEELEREYPSLLEAPVVANLLYNAAHDPTLLPAPRAMVVSGWRGN